MDLTELLLTGSVTPLAPGDFLRKSTVEDRRAARELLERLSTVGDLKGITAAVENGDIKDLAAVDEDDKTAIHFAARAGHLHVVEYLLSTGFDVNVKDRAGFTPFLYAVAYGHTNLIRYFLSRSDVDFHIANVFGFTAMMIAHHCENSAVMELLQRHGLSSENSYATLEAHTVISKVCKNEKVITRQHRPVLAQIN